MALKVLHIVFSFYEKLFNGWLIIDEDDQCPFRR